MAKREKKAAPAASKENATVTPTEVTGVQPNAVNPADFTNPANPNIDLDIDANGVSIKVLGDVVVATRNSTFVYVNEAVAAKMVEYGFVQLHPSMVGPDGTRAARATDAGMKYFDETMAARAASQPATQPASDPWASVATAPVAGVMQPGLEPSAQPTPTIVPDFNQPQPNATQAALQDMGNAASAAIAAGAPVTVVPKKPSGPRSAPVFTKKEQITGAVANIPLPASRKGEGFGTREQVYPFASLTAVGMSFFIEATAEKPKPGKSIGAALKGAAKKFNAEYTSRDNIDGAPWGRPGKKGCGVWRIK